VKPAPEYQIFTQDETAMKKSLLKIVENFDV